MKKNLIYCLILFSICAICALVLALANSVTAPVIALHAEEARVAALSLLSGGREIGEEVSVSDREGIVSSIPLLEGGKTTGYILTLTGNGYGGAFTMMASYRTDGSILAAKMLENSETPGQGKRSEEAWYMEKFIGKGTAESPVPTEKSMLSKEESDAVSGASVTFAGVSGTLARGASYVLSLGGGK